MKFGICQYFQPTPRNIRRWMLAVKGILASVSGAAYLEGNTKVAFWLLIITGTLSELSNLIGQKNT